MRSLIADLAARILADAAASFDRPVGLIGFDGPAEPSALVRLKDLEP